jgi:hypothetical protein
VLCPRGRGDRCSEVKLRHKLLYWLLHSTTRQCGWDADEILCSFTVPYPFAMHEGWWGFDRWTQVSYMPNEESMPANNVKTGASQLSEV